MPTKETLKLSTADRKELSSWQRMTSLNQGQATRAKIILSLAEGESPTEVARAQRVTRKTVYTWRDRFERDGVGGLLDKPRPGRPSVIDEKTVKKVLRLTTERIPQESTHWSVRLMAEYAGVTTWQVRQIWKATGLKPHRIETFKISNDPAFAEKVVDVVGLYMDPPSNAMVLSVDEKSQIQALERTQPGLPLRPGRLPSQTHDYKRHGTASLYAAFNIASGEVIGAVTKRHRSKEFLAFLRQIDRATPQKLDLHIILDNVSAHKTKKVRDWLEDNPRVHFHFTPTSASWLNAVEGWFAQLERRALYRNSFTNVKELRTEIKRYIAVHNKRLAKPFKWTRSAKAIMKSVARARKALPN